VSYLVLYRMRIRNCGHCVVLLLGTFCDVEPPVTRIGTRGPEIQPRRGVFLWNMCHSGHQRRRVGTRRTGARVTFTREIPTELLIGSFSFRTQYNKHAIYAYLDIMIYLYNRPRIPTNENRPNARLCEQIDETRALYLIYYIYCTHIILYNIISDIITTTTTVI